MSRSWIGPGLILLVIACGVSDRNVQEANAGGAGGASGSGGSDDGGDPGTSSVGGSAGASAGGSDSGGNSGSDSGGNSGSDSGGNSGSDSGGDSGAGGASGVCSEGSLRCTDDTPEECQGGTWVSLDPCPAHAPACTNGVCAAARIVGGLVTVRQPASAGEIRLRDHGFEFQPRLCGAVGAAMVCATGGIKP